MKKIGRQAISRRGVILPPLIEAYETIVVHIDLVEEACHPPPRHNETCSSEGIFKLISVQFPIMVPVDRPEEKKKL